MATCPVIVLPDRRIQQYEVESLLSIESRIRRLKRERNDIAHNLLDRHLSGQRLEPGIYCLELVEKTRGRERSTRLVIR